MSLTIRKNYFAQVTPNSGIALFFITVMHLYILGIYGTNHNL